MALTKNDLQAIRSIVEEAIEDSDRRTAAGFAEVHEKFAQVDERFAQVDERFAQVDEHFGKIEARLDSIENKLDPTIDMVDDHEVRLTKLETNPA